jgi:parallel beta-helix repeat protein
MNTTSRIIAVTALSSALLAGFLLALPSTGQAAAPVSISSCTTISTRGHYELVADLTSSGTCIKITASHVKLKLNGHTITGPSAATVDSSGIQLVAISHVDIEGPGVITNFGIAVDFEGADFSEVKDVTSTGNLFGFVLNRDFVTPNLNNFSEKNLFRGNTSTGNTIAGFTLNGATNNHLINNVASNNTGNGIFIEAGTENQLKENTANGNGVSGIVIADGSTGNSVRGNTAQSNSSAVDLADDNPNCDNNVWLNNVFNTANQTCIQ